MEIIFICIWVAFTAITFFNAMWIRSNAQEYIARDPALKDGYDKMIKVYIILLNIPLIIIAIGSFTGITKSVFDYLRPKTLNPAVLVFHTYIIVLWVWSIFWIYFQNGAEFLERHPGLIRVSNFKTNIYPTAKQIKLFFSFCINWRPCGNDCNVDYRYSCSNI
jgi:hypothetical protein